MLEEVGAFAADPEPPGWLCLDFAAIGDVDFAAAAAAALRRAHAQLHQVGARLVFSEVPDSVRRSLDRYGLLQLVGERYVYADLDSVLAGYRSSQAAGAR